MNPVDLIPALLLLLLGAVLASGALLAALIAIWRREDSLSVREESELASFPPASPPTVWRRPACWLAIRGRNVTAVQAALGLSEARSCSWQEGLNESVQLFISPPCHGWILVFGAGLPDPADDVDECFRFLTQLSCRTGQVQWFKTDAILHHHAWARLDAGRVVRAYAWAGRTVWNQGAKTPAELELGMKCFAYDETGSITDLGLNDIAQANVEKVPRLASRWSLNPAAIDAHFLELARGIASWPSQRI